MNPLNRNQKLGLQPPTLFSHNSAWSEQHVNNRSMVFCQRHLWSTHSMAQREEWKCTDSFMISNQFVTWNKLQKQQQSPFQLKRHTMPFCRWVRRGCSAAERRCFLSSQTHRYAPLQQGGTILLLRAWPPKILIQHVRMLSVVHVLKLITVSTFSKNKNKIPEVLLASPRHPKTDMLQQRNKKKSWKINKLCGYMLSAVIERLLFIQSLNMRSAIYVDLTQINDILNLISVGWFTIDKTHTDASSSNLIIRLES